MNTITGSKDEKINKIQHEDSTILLKYQAAPSQITYALVVNKDLKSIHHFFQSIVDIFEIVFREVLWNLNQFKEDPALIFGSFDGYIKDFLKR